MFPVRILGRDRLVLAGDLCPPGLEPREVCNTCHCVGRRGVCGGWRRELILWLGWQAKGILTEIVMAVQTEHYVSPYALLSVSEDTLPRNNEGYPDAGLLSRLFKKGDLKAEHIYMDPTNAIPEIAMDSGDQGNQCIVPPLLNPFDPAMVSQFCFTTSLQKDGQNPLSEEPVTERGFNMSKLRCGMKSACSSTPTCLTSDASLPLNVQVPWPGL